MVLPDFSSLAENPNYEIERYESGEIKSIKRVGQYTFNQVGDRRDVRPFVREEYNFSKSGEFIGGVVRDTRVSRFRNDSYSEAIYDRTIYKAEPSLNRISISTYETVAKSSGAETVKFLEREILEGGQRIEYQSKTNLTPTQKQYQEEVQARARPGLSSQNSFLDRNKTGQQFQPESPAQQILALEGSKQFIQASPGFSALREKRIQEQGLKITSPTPSEVSFGGGAFTITGTVSPAKQKRISPPKAVKPSSVSLELPVLDPDLASGVRADLLLKDIQQTSPRFKLAQDFPELQKLAIKEASGVISATPIISPKPLQFQDILAKELKEAPVISKLGVSIKNVISYSLFKEEESRGKSVGGALLLGVSTIGKVSYEVTGLGITESLITKGVYETAESYNPITFTKSVIENKVLRSQTPLYRTVEAGSLVVGLALGKKVNDITLNYAGTKIRSFNKKLETVKLTKEFKKSGPSDISMELEGSQVKFQKTTESGIKVPQYGDRFPEVTRKVIQRKTIKSSNYEIEIRKFKSYDPLKDPLKNSVDSGLREIPKPKDLKASQTTRLDKKFNFNQDIDFKFSGNPLADNRLSFSGKLSALVDKGPIFGQLAPPIQVIDPFVKSFKSSFSTNFQGFQNLPSSKLLIFPPSDIQIKEEESKDFASFFPSQSLASSVSSKKTTIVEDLRIQEVTPNIKSIPDVGLNIDTSPDITQKRTPIISPSIDTSPATGPDLSSKLSQLQTPKLKEVPKSGLLFAPGLNLDTSQKQKKPSYDVYAKEKGRFLKLNKDPLPINKAKNLGAEAVDNSASAQFKLNKSTKMGKNIPDDPFFTKESKFRKKSNSYIELNKNRIDTPGEISGISLKGWIANKRKSSRLGF